MVRIAVVPPAGRSLTETLRLVDTVVWSVCTVVVLAFIAASVAGAFLVAGQPVTLPAAAFLAAVVVGTFAFVVADVVSE
jgi:hypothetical protein